MTQSSGFTVNGDGTTTIQAQFTFSTSVLLETIDAAAHYLWDHGKGDHGTEEEPIAFDDLTNQQKLTIVVSHWKQVTVDAADTYTATDYHNSYVPTEHGIG